MGTVLLYVVGVVLTLLFLVLTLSAKNMWLRFLYIAAYYVAFASVAYHALRPYVPNLWAWVIGAAAAVVVELVVAKYWPTPEAMARTEQRAEQEIKLDREERMRRRPSL